MYIQVLPEYAVSQHEQSQAGAIAADSTSSLVDQDRLFVHESEQGPLK